MIVKVKATKESDKKRSGLLEETIEHKIAGMVIQGIIVTAGKGGCKKQSGILEETIDHRIAGMGM